TGTTARATATGSPTTTVSAVRIAWSCGASSPARLRSSLPSRNRSNGTIATATRPTSTSANVWLPAVS
ncbi:unnamed protein product, partial [Nesidiocoris tenuis]